jgi:tetratricopeptide (TPR) repeat protein
VQTQVARALGLQGQFEPAIQLLDSLRSRDPELVARLDLERGRVLNSSGHPDEARRLFEAAFGGASDARLEFLAVDALHMLAIVAPPAEQDGFNRRALELAEAAADPRARQWRGSLLNNMGWSAFDRGDLDTALALFEDALAAREEQGKQSEIVVARWCIARCLRELARVDEALAIQLELAAELTAGGKTDQYVDEELSILQQNTTPDPGSG